MHYPNLDGRGVHLLEALYLVDGSAVLVGGGGQLVQVVGGVVFDARLYVGPEGAELTQYGTCGVHTMDTGELVATTFTGRGRSLTAICFFSSRLERAPFVP